MANIAGKLGLKVVTIAIGIPVGILAKRAVEKAWLAARPEDPPRKPNDPDVSWGDALGWAALSAVGVAVADLVTTKGAASVWRSLTGGEPAAKPAPAAKVAAKVS